jgi:tripartite-type tricarboxylate transporter receptor subunit TctC
MKPYPFLIQHRHVPPASAMPRRRKLLALSALLCMGVVAGMPKATHAQDVWPSKPLRLIVPFTPGGVTDTSGRLIAESLGKRLGQQIVVDNKSGASGNIGTALAKSAPADGYTLVLGFDGTMVINPHVFSKLPFDTAKDFAPVGKIGDATLVLVANPGVPVKGLADVIVLSKTQPGGLSFGTSGTGAHPILPVNY